MQKIGLISAHNPFDRNNFSGTAYYILQALNRVPDVQVEVIGEKFHLAGNLSSRAYRSLNHGRFASLTWVRDRLFKQFIGLIEKDLTRLKSDLDFIVAPVASEIIANLQFTSGVPPILFVTDATPQFIRETYPQPIEDIAFEQERRVLARSAKIIYSSHFMAKRASNEFADVLSNSRDKIEVVPFGLNMDRVPQQESPKELAQPLELLFVGKDWQRKGGDIAVDMLTSLQEKGVKARLTVIGCEPALKRVPGNLEIIPYLNKNVPEQQDQYEEILKRSHFLVLPTRADCTPMVIAEANAFGIPVLASDVGGLATLIEPGQNGYLLPSTAPGHTYGDIVVKMLDEPETYRRLAETCRLAYDEKLNWDAWTRQVFRIASSLKPVQDFPTRSYGN